MSFPLFSETKAFKRICGRRNEIMELVLLSDFLFTFFNISRISTVCVRASNEFLTDLFVTLEGPSENIVISPFSIFTGLALLELGSAGSTRTNLESALHFPPGEPYTIHDEGHAIISSLDKMSKSSNESFILQTSNGVFLDDDFSISDEYRYRRPHTYMIQTLLCFSD